MCSYHGKQQSEPKDEMLVVYAFHFHPFCHIFIGYNSAQLRGWKKDLDTVNVCNVIKKMYERMILWRGSCCRKSSDVNFAWYVWQCDL